VKYEKASSAALAVENLHEVTLNNGAGPRLKVMLAESPSARNNPGSQSYSSAQRNLSQDIQPAISEDPDNMPPRSRLFIVVPKNAIGADIEARMNEFPGLQYCKTDLIASKGIVFAKYDASSSAYAAMEAVQASGSIAGYRVKVMIAEPKNQRRMTTMGSMGSIVGAIGSMGSTSVMTGMSLADLDISPSANGSGLNTAMHGSSSQLQSGINISSGMNGAMAGGMSKAMNASGMNGGVSGGLHRINGLNGMTANDLGNGSSFPSSELANNLSLSFHSSHSQPMDLNSVPPGNRLFIVVHKGVNEESLASLFRCYPGMEYINLKRDRVTGRSKGYAYVNYFNLESATLAQAQLNGIEFPQGSGCMLKVLFAAPLTISSSSRQNESLKALSVSSGNSGADLTHRSSPAKSFLQGSHPSTAMNTPSHDTTATNFQLPSPNMSNSGSDSVGQAFGYGDFGQTVQNSARTDLSSTSHDSFVSPLSSPLGKSNMNGGTHETAGHAVDMSQIDKIQQSLVDLRLDFGLFDEAHDADPHCFFGGGNRPDEAALNKSLRDSIESSFGSFTPNNRPEVGNARETADAGDVIRKKDSLTTTASPHREVYTIFAEPPQSDKVHKMFEVYGNVENIELIGNKMARIRYEDVDAAHSAMTGVNDLAGVLTVSSSPPQSM
jgi:RNA recognition motif-containing protein